MKQQISLIMLIYFNTEACFHNPFYCVIYAVQSFILSPKIQHKNCYIR